MKSRRFLSCLLALSAVSSLALADEVPVTQWAKDRVQTALVTPLAERDQVRFSRVVQPPKERRVRVTQATETLDRNGRSFVRFAVDVRYGGEWHKDDIVGCAYRGSGDLYVKKGAEYRPAQFLLGKNVAPVAGVCEGAPVARS